MPRTMDPVLRQGLERANPVTCDIVEVSSPDATRVLRRANDQFFTTPPRVSETPASSSAADANGALILTPTDTQIASLYVENSAVQFGATVDPSTIIKGVGWTMPADFGRAVLKRFTARIHRLLVTPVDLELRIYRPKIQRMYYRNAGGFVQEVRGVTFLEILPEPVVVRYASIAWGGLANAYADVVFDLSHIRPEIGPGPLLNDPVANDPDALNPHFIFQINPVNPPRGGIMEWMIDQTTSIDVAGMGRFQEIAWTRPAAHTDKVWMWGVAKQNYSECFKLEIEQYAAGASLVYLIDLGKVPSPDATVRIVFERSVPPGTNATLELSTAGSGGPWTVVAHADVIAKQQQYHLRLSLQTSPSSRHTPRVAAFGVDARIPLDVSAEAIVEPIAHEIQVPYCHAGIGEGRATLIRAGRRDYRDVGTELAVRYPASKIEIDHYIGSRLAKIGRHRWFHFERAPVSNREPTETGETFTLLSPLKALKRKIPARIETINTVHSVVSATTGQIQVTPNIQGATGTGDYLGQGYYVRVRSSAQLGMPPGLIQTIDNNTNLNIITFTAPLPGTLIAGDVVEIHSAQYAQPTIEWIDADPADIWWELFTDHLGISAEQLGLGGTGQASRSGLPPRVTDRAPGDAATQAKLKVTLRIGTEEDGDKLIDQVSFLLGGCTVAIGGQFVFRQIYPLRNAAGDITVPTPTPAKTFDPRDYSGLQTPTGLEQRITQLSCDYGVNTTLVSDDTQAASTVVVVDADAMAYLAPQDVEGLGRATVPKEISRWLFNSADEGLFFAQQLALQVVNVASTGLRVWSFTSVDANPELHIGDAIWVVTDQYTDYDPARKLQIRGWWTYKGIIVSVQATGRRFRILLPGLAATTQLKGGLGDLASPPIPASPAAPSATITPDLSVRSRTTETLIFDGAIGLGDAGPLLWRYRIDDGAYTAPSAAPLPQSVVISRSAFYDREVTLEVIQGDGQPANAQYTVGPRMPAIDDVTGRKKRTEPNDDGDYDVSSTTNDGRTAHSGVKDSTAREIRRQFAKPLPSDPDDADSVGNGLTRRAVPFTELHAINGLLTRVARTATIGPQANDTALAVLKRAGIFFEEHFDDTPNDAGWANSGTATESLVTTVGVSRVGNSVLQAAGGLFWRVFPQKLAFNPSKLYRLRARFRQTVDSVVGNRFVYIGLRAFLADASPANSNTGYCYVVAFGHSLAVADGWQEFTRWVKGASLTFVDTPVPSADPRSPSPLNVDTVAISPMVAGNYAAGVGTIQFDYYQIEELDEDAAERIYETVQSDAATLYGTVKESGGKTVNRQFAKPLSSDPDDLDSVGNGSTYARPLATRINSGRPVLDFSEGIHSNKNGQFIDRFAGAGVTLHAATQQLDNNGHAGASMTESGTKALNRLYAKSLSSDADALGSVADDLTYKKVLAVSSGLITPSSLQSRHRVRVTSGSTTIPTSTFTALAWTAEDYDASAMHDNSTNPSRLTVPSGGNVGVWILVAQIEWDTNATGFREAIIVKNGLVFLATTREQGNAVGIKQILTAVDDSPAVGDYYEVKLEQSSGANRSAGVGNSFFSAVHLW